MAATGVGVSRGHDGFGDRWVQRTKESVFGLFHSMTERDSRARITFKSQVWSVMLLVIDAIQVMLLQVGPDFGWSSDALGWLQSVSLLDLLVPDADPKLFNVVFAAVALMVTASLVDAAFVIHMFRTNKFSHIWTLRVLRFAVSILVTAAFVPTLGILLTPFSCDDMKAYNGESFSCTSFHSVAMQIVSVLVVSLYIPFGLASSAAFFESSPASSDVVSKTSGREALYGILAKMLGVLSNHFGRDEPMLMAALLFTAYVGITAHSLAVLPFYHMPLNRLRVGASGATAWLALGSVLLGSGVVEEPYSVELFSIWWAFATFIVGALFAWTPSLRWRMMRHRLDSVLEYMLNEMNEGMTEAESRKHIALAMSRSARDMQFSISAMPKAVSTLLAAAGRARTRVAEPHSIEQMAQGMRRSVYHSQRRMPLFSVPGATKSNLKNADDKLGDTNTEDADSAKMRKRRRSSNVITALSATTPSTVAGTTATSGSVSTWLSTQSPARQPRRPPMHAQGIHAPVGHPYAGTPAAKPSGRSMSGSLGVRGSSGRLTSLADAKSTLAPTSVDPSLPQAAVSGCNGSAVSGAGDPGNGVLARTGDASTNSAATSPPLSGPAAAPLHSVAGDALARTSGPEFAIAAGVGPVMLNPGGRGLDSGIDDPREGDLVHARPFADLSLDTHVKTGAHDFTALDVGSDDGVSSGAEGASFDSELERQAAEREAEARAVKAQEDAVFEGLYMYEVELLVRIMLDTNDSALVAHRRMRHRWTCMRSSRLVVTQLAVERIMWLLLQAANEFTFDRSELATAKLYFARYLHEFTADDNLAMNALDDAGRAEQGMEGQFEVFTRTQRLRQQKATRDVGASKTMNAIALVEFNRRLATAVQRHQEALAAKTKIVAHITRNRAKIDANDPKAVTSLEESLDTLGSSAKTADQLYLRLMNGNAATDRLSPVYRRFCIDILGDYERAKFFAPAGADGASAAGSVTGKSVGRSSAGAGTRLSDGRRTAGGISSMSASDSSREFVPKNRSRVATVLASRYQIGVAVMLLMSVAMFTVTRVLMSTVNHQMIQIGDVGLLRWHTVNVGVQSRRIIADTPGSNDTAANDIAQFKTLVQTAFDDTVEFQEVSRSWVAPIVPLLRRETHLDTVANHTVMLNTRDACASLITAMDAIIPAGSFNNASWIEARFALENALTVLPYVDTIVGQLEEHVHANRGPYMILHSSLISVLVVTGLYIVARVFWRSLAQTASLKALVREVATKLPPLTLQTMRQDMKRANAALGRAVRRLALEEDEGGEEDRGVDPDSNFRYDADEREARRKRSAYSRGSRSFGDSTLAEEGDEEDSRDGARGGGARGTRARRSSIDRTPFSRNRRSVRFATPGRRASIDGARAASPVSKNLSAWNADDASTTTATAMTLPSAVPRSSPAPAPTSTSTVAQAPAPADTKETKIDSDDSDDMEMALVSESTHDLLKAAREEDAAAGDAPVVADATTAVAVAAATSDGASADAATATGRTTTSASTTLGSLLGDKSQVELPTLCGAMPAGLVAATTDGTILYSNDAMQDISGYSPQELLGKNVTVFIPPEISRVHKKLMNRVVPKELGGEGGDPKVIGHMGRQLTLINKDKAPVNVLLSLNYSEDKNGDMIFVANIQNLTANEASNEASDEDSDAEGGSGGSGKDASDSRERWQIAKVILSVLLVTCLQGSNFIFGASSFDSIVDHATELNLAGSLRFLAHEAVFVATEMAVGDDVVLTEAQANVELEHVLTDLEDRRFALRFGSDVWDLEGSIGRSEAEDALHFGSSLGGGGGGVDIGLDQHIANFARDARLLARAFVVDGAPHTRSNATKLANVRLLAGMIAAEEGVLSTRMKQSVGFYKDDTHVAVANVLSIDMAISIANMVLVSALYFFVLHGTVVSIRGEVARSEVLLQILTDDVAGSPAFRKYYVRARSHT